MNFSQENILSLLCAIPGLVAGLTIHEYAHAWMGNRLGDDTSRRLGRLTLNPAAHIDAFGAIFFLLAWFSGFGLGWAKPVPINPRNLKHPRRDNLLIAIAGPVSNVLQLPVWLSALFFFGLVSSRLGWQVGSGNAAASFITMALLYGVMINAGLAAFNMIPFPPLDGHWVLQSIGGRSVERLYEQIRPFSFIALIALINFTPILRYTIGPVQAGAMHLAEIALRTGSFWGDIPTKLVS